MSVKEEVSAIPKQDQSADTDGNGKGQGDKQENDTHMAEQRECEQPEHKQSENEQAEHEQTEHEAEAVDGNSGDISRITISRRDHSGQQDTEETKHDHVETRPQDMQPDIAEQETENPNEPVKQPRRLAVLAREQLEKDRQKGGELFKRRLYELVREHDKENLDNQFDFSVGMATFGASVAIFAFYVLTPWDILTLVLISFGCSLISIAIALAVYNFILFNRANNTLDGKKKE